MFLKLLSLSLSHAIPRAGTKLVAGLRTSAGAAPALFGSSPIYTALMLGMCTPRATAHDENGTYREACIYGPDDVIFFRT